MRNNSSLIIKRTVPCLAVVVALTATSMPAHAGFFKTIVNIATQALNGKKTESKSTQGSAATQTATASTAATSQAPSHTSTSAEVKNTSAKVGSSTEAPQLFSVSEFVNKVTIGTQNQAGAWFKNLRNSSMATSEKVSEVKTATHTEIVPVYTNDGLSFLFRYDDVAIKNPELLIKDLALVTALTASSQGISSKSQFFLGTLDEKTYKEIESPHAVAELIANVREGSPTAIARWTELQANILKNISLKNEYIDKMNLKGTILEDIHNQLLSDLAKQEEAALKYSRQQQKALDKWKAETGTLDKMEAMQEKLDDLILNNDRKGVRKVLEAYLPWSVMEPVEANTWKIWLDAIENPDPTKTTVAFRGLKYDTDKIQRRQTAKGEIFGFMSTVLTKNQGSYTRRLRSLSTNREKNGDLGFTNHGEKIRSVRITDQMTSHARNPVASSFISFTYNPSIAVNFMGNNVIKEIKGEKVSVPYGGLLVVKMDSRRMIPNIPSMYGNEIELLAPLIVFPDEVIQYKEGNFTAEYSYAEFIKDVSQKTGINFANWSSAEDANNENLRSRYNREGHEFLKQMVEVEKAGASCSVVF